MKHSGSTVKCRRVHWSFCHKCKHIGMPLGQHFLDIITCPQLQRTQEQQGRASRHHPKGSEIPARLPCGGLHPWRCPRTRDGTPVQSSQPTSKGGPEGEEGCEVPSAPTPCDARCPPPRPSRSPSPAQRPIGRIHVAILHHDSAADETEVIRHGRGAQLKAGTAPGSPLPPGTTGTPRNSDTTTHLRVPRNRKST